MVIDVQNATIDKDEEYLSFVEDENEEIKQETKETKSDAKQWKILIVDDEESVHSITKIILRNFEFAGRKLEFLSAYSCNEAKRIVKENSDIAIILLDVVMETDNAGFDLVKYIRKELNNQFVRIILRTGQPGQAPERKVIVDYDINDYKLKTELTEDKLFVSVITALRSYNDIYILDQHRKSLEKLIEASTELFKKQSFKEFIPQILNQFLNILNTTSKSIEVSGLIASKQNNQLIIETAAGEFSKYIDMIIDDALPPQKLNEIDKVINNKSVSCSTDSFVSYFDYCNEKGSLIYLKNIDNLGEFDRKMLEILTNNASIAYTNKCLNEEIETTQKEIIFSLGEIAEFRSKETGNHVKRVAEYTRLLALEYGLHEEESENIRIASAMHDIGKLAIPDAILNKPGKLTTEEFEVIKTHSQIGYEMLKNSRRNIMKDAAIIALQHHEKYDGSGYPLKLKGEDIHLFGRITAVADVFDALASDRVYKKAWEIDRIVELFETEKGKHFDPVLVEILFKLFDEFIKIREKYNDLAIYP